MQEEKLYRGHEEILGVIVNDLNYGDGFTELYICQNTYFQNVNTNFAHKFVWFIICQLYCNKNYKNFLKYF